MVHKESSSTEIYLTQDPQSQTPWVVWPVIAVHQPQPRSSGRFPLREWCSTAMTRRSSARPPGRHATCGHDCHAETSQSPLTDRRSTGRRKKVQRTPATRYSAVEVRSFPHFAGAACRSRKRRRQSGHASAVPLETSLADLLLADDNPDTLPGIVIRGEMKMCSSAEDLGIHRLSRVARSLGSGSTADDGSKHVRWWQNGELACWERQDERRICSRHCCEVLRTSSHSR